MCLSSLTFTCIFYCTPAHTLSYIRTYCHATFPIYSSLAILYYLLSTFTYFLRFYMSISLYPGLRYVPYTVLHTCYYAHYTRKPYLRRLTILYYFYLLVISLSSFVRTCLTLIYPGLSLFLYTALLSYRYLIFAYNPLLSTYSISIYLLSILFITFYATIFL
jgi:hypothetical protein